MASLRGARLRAAKLHKAYLVGADLAVVHFGGADLTGYWMALEIASLIDASSGLGSARTCSTPSVRITSNS